MAYFNPKSSSSTLQYGVHIRTCATRRNNGSQLCSMAACKLTQSSLSDPSMSFNEFLSGSINTSQTGLRLRSIGISVHVTSAFRFCVQYYIFSSRKFEINVILLLLYDMQYMGLYTLKFQAASSRKQVNMYQQRYNYIQISYLNVCSFEAKLTTSIGDQTDNI